jgi:nitroreductase
MDLQPMDYDAATTLRNQRLISPQEQATLRAARFLIAACGGVGGSAIEPLARLGAMRFRFADPDRYELSNINRQLCRVDEIGRFKPEVLADRALGINPFAEVSVYNEGVTQDNIDELLDGVTIVLDGIAPGNSAWEKYLLHLRAAELGLPVMSGYSFGGKPCLYIFDYRRDPRPYYGKADVDAHRENRYRDARRWLGYFHFPADFMPVMRYGFRNGGTWPRVSYTVQGMGALICRTSVDLLMSREVRHVVSVDLHRVTRPYPRALGSLARLPLEMLPTLLVAKRYSDVRRPQQSTPADGQALSQTLAAVLEAARSAPSRYNTQPWALRVVGENIIQLDRARDRMLGAADRQERVTTYALGCAVEAMSYVADVEWRSANGSSRGSAGHIGELEVAGLRESDLLVRQAVLGARVTNRGDYRRERLDPLALRAAQDAAGEFDVSIEVADDRARIEQVAEVARAAIRSQMADSAYVNEFRRWMRRTDDEPTGVNLGLVLGTLGDAPGGRMRDAGLTTALSVRVTRAVRNSGALLVLRMGDDDEAAWLRAGRALMRVWLVLTEAGYAVGPEQTPLETPQGALAIRSVLGVDGEGTLVTMLRVGRPLSEPRPSRRLPLSTVATLDTAPSAARPAGQPGTKRRA